MTLADILLTVAALPLLAASLYLAALALVPRHRAPCTVQASRLRFDVIVPAHNEENDIAETVRSLRAVSYPAELFRVLVVADNCTDGTAAQAAAAGAQVLVRTDSESRGKGYALAYAFERSLSDRLADAIIVVDADTLVSSNLLTAFAARFSAGETVVQADYGVRNHDSSWRTRLMTIALAAFHGIRSLARERLGLSCGLRGNGMGFLASVIAAHPPRAFSIVEDLEYGIQLGYAGIRVAYAHEARVLGQMAISESASRSQRRRWERGRQALVRAHVPILLRQAWKGRNALLLDLAVDLLVPPIGTLVLVSVVGLMVSGFAAAIVDLLVAPWVWGVTVFGVFLHVLRGWSISGVGIRGLVDLLWAPVYIIWKLTLRFSDRGRAPEEWVRTKREVHS